MSPSSPHHPVIPFKRSLPQLLCAAAFSFAALRSDGLVQLLGAPSAVDLGEVSSLVASAETFAALRKDGSVALVTAQNSETVRLLETKYALREICTSAFAFAGITNESTVVAWGAPEFGGDSSGVEAQLKEVKQICATESGFAALRQDGLVVSWGTKGGDSQEVRHLLKDIQQIESSSGAFAAIRADGLVVTWGQADAGGSPNGRVKEQLRNVHEL
ncbi:Sulfhydryl oxidase [Durusdinium trenchii]|uniref:Sulfhydryl oxidase n=1 Tax=Durusdinium trenchii TaxID=1381693 RepID=A0ABP0JIW2_9DINO